MFEWPNEVQMPPSYNMARHGHEHLIKQSKEICEQIYAIIQQLPIPSDPLSLDFGAGVGTGLPESCSDHVSAGVNASQCQHSFDVVSQLPDALPN